MEVLEPEIRMPIKEKAIFEKVQIEKVLEPEIRMPIKEKAIFEKVQIEKENADTFGFVLYHDKKLVV